ncbi:hypothetical protein EGW08_001374 [Elysia chlorotica]|uniref:Uncharacterized protein n=1 Tax=Elysia chlorotica TaxID=188477 RepID=A0A433UAM5_ELYCH|nr:hypothetical protein EGW08_001374 [Elysia chlorotica]
MVVHVPVGHYIPHHIQLMYRGHKTNLLVTVPGRRTECRKCGETTHWTNQCQLKRERLEPRTNAEDQQPHPEPEPEPEPPKKSKTYAAAAAPPPSDLSADDEDEEKGTEWTTVQPRRKRQRRGPTPPEDRDRSQSPVSEKRKENKRCAVRPGGRRRGGTEDKQQPPPPHRRGDRTRPRRRDRTEERKRVCLETYRKEVERLIISFAVLGAEECETCKRHSEHMGDRGTAETCGCELYQHHSEHIRRRDEARAAYKMDAGRTHDDQEIITSVDLQKVMMLPRLPGVKSFAFPKRIVVFNETFAGLGTSCNNVAVVWNESVSAVNSHDISANEITFKYLETGHTFMAADSVHHSIERQLKKCGDVRDFQEYVDSLEKA